MLIGVCLAAAGIGALVFIGWKCIDWNAMETGPGPGDDEI